MSYTGPRNIVILGGGIAGLAAADAITSALAELGEALPEGIEITLVEGERAVGGRAASAPVDELRELHPHAPYRANIPHGIHFVWGCYRHFIRFCGDAGAPLTPKNGTTTYCSWLGPPDLAGDAGAPARVVALHVCDPAEPDAAWDPRARAILNAYARSSRVVGVIETAIAAALNRRIAFVDYLSYLDILFADDVLAPELRWRIFSAGVFGSLARQPESSPLLRDMLGGRAPTDVDIGDLMSPTLLDQLAPQIRRTTSTIRHAAVEPVRRQVGLPKDRVRANGESLGVRDELRALAGFATLVVRDARSAVARRGSFHPKQSGYLKNILKAAFSSPYALDVATAIRDAQFGLMNHAASVLRTFDGGDSRAVFEGVRRRVEARFDGGRLRGSLRLGAWCKRIEIDEGAVVRVEITDRTARPPAPVPTMRAAAFGPTTETLEADVVVSSLLPRSLAAVLDGAPSDLARKLQVLGRYMNETINLQLFFPERHELPFPPLPPGSKETPPISISNIEGPFTIAVDCARAHSEEAFSRIALTKEDADGGLAFAGTAWELVGAYADLFTFDEHADASRYQWPLAVQQKLAALLHDPADFVAGTADERPWVHDIGAPGRLPPPFFGEVKLERAAAYLARWQNEASPLIVATTLRQLAALPGMSDRTLHYLLREADHIELGEPTNVRWALVRNAQADNRFFSAEPGLFAHRPHARFEVGVRGLWVCGDWTRNGLNLQSMEAAVVSGIAAAQGVLERMRVGGMHSLRPPLLSPDILPPGAWDTGV